MIKVGLDLLAKQEQLRVMQKDGKRYLFDTIRKKWLVIQPEELVRQLMVLYLIEELHYNKNRINVETGLLVKLRFDELQKRSDILVYDDDMNPFLLVECKAPTVELGDLISWQTWVYNLTLKVPYQVWTNGIETYCLKLDHDGGSYEFLSEIPLGS